MKTLASLAPRRHALLALLLAGLDSAGAQTRWVVVNGQRLSDAEVQHFDRLQCTRIPNGHYWLDERSGVWGYTGNPPAPGTRRRWLPPDQRSGPHRPLRDAALRLRGRGRASRAGCPVGRSARRDGWYVHGQR